MHGNSTLKFRGSGKKLRGSAKYLKIVGKSGKNVGKRIHHLFTSKVPSQNSSQNIGTDQDHNFLSIQIVFEFCQSFFQVRRGLSVSMISSRTRKLWPMAMVNLIKTVFIHWYTQATIMVASYAPGVDNQVTIWWAAAY
jgi:hypothetical protein